MTLDCCIFSSMHVQPRVISVLSYYLTSLVNLSFCSFLRRCLLFLHTFRRMFLSTIFTSFSRKREPSMPEQDLWILASSFRSLRLHSLSRSMQMFSSFRILYFAFFRCCKFWLLPTSSSILLPVKVERSRFVYLYIGITLSDYTVAQGFSFCNMESYTKWTKVSCTNSRK